MPEGQQIIINNSIILNEVVYDKAWGNVFDVMWGYVGKQWNVFILGNTDGERFKIVYNRQYLKEDVAYEIENYFDNYFKELRRVS